MRFASIRIITDDVDRLADFYATVTGITPERPAPVFAAFRSGDATLAIGARATIAMLPEGTLAAAANSSVIIEFQVDDVDAEYARLRDTVDSWVLEPTDMPWGNRSALLRDPDGNVVNLFAPLAR
jgi:predicted enzyme related to lactoylglutathione lyase